MRALLKFGIGLALAAALLAVPKVLPGQSFAVLRCYYDDLGQLTKVVDPSGNVTVYTYDAVGNMLSITRSTLSSPSALAIFNFTPQQGAVGTIVTIQGQNFSTTAASNAVSFSGAAATVLSATANTLTASVPATATTGPISVTVSGVTATSTNNFTFIPVPAILSVTPKYLLSGSSSISAPNFQVTGAMLTGATFSFSPAFNPSPITINSATIDPSGSSAVLNLTVAPGTLGSFTLIGTNATGASSQVASSGNTLQIISADGDADGDGLTNAVEVAIGTDPLNPATSGDGLPDGWQVFYELNPLDPAVAAQDFDNSGLTVLQDFQKGLSPRNPNLVPPAVSVVSPANGATGVFVNDVVVVRFAEPLLTGTSLTAAQSALNAALGSSSTVPAASQQIAAQTLQAYMNRTCCGNSVTTATVSLSGPAGGIVGAVTPSNDGLSATFAPSRPLPSNTQYTVQVNGVRDSAGNLMTQGFTSSFTTGSAADNTPPTIKLVDPENGSTNVPTNAHYVVQFSKAMDPSTLTPSSISIFDTVGNTYIPGIVQVDASNTTASFIPASALPIGRTLTVSVSNSIKDIAGNNLIATFSYTFTTGTVNEAAPHFLGNSPMSGASGVPVNALIDLQFSEPLDVVTVVPNIQLTLGGQAIPVMMALSNGDQRVTITPASVLQANAIYTVTIGPGISDIAGPTVDNPSSFTFQTSALVDTTQLMVVSLSPQNTSTGVPLNAQVEVGFNKPVDAVTVGGGNLLLYPCMGCSLPGVGVPGSTSVSADGLSVRFTPASVLVPETHYCVYLSGMVDLEGQSLKQNGQTVDCFTTGVSAQTVGPIVTGVSPANGATGVPVNATVGVSVSTPISPVSVGSGAITLTAGGQPVAGTVSVPDSSTVLFAPSAPLAVNTAYSVTVGGFTDVAGNAVQAFTSVFTTSTSSVADSGPLLVSSITPANHSIGVAVTTNVVVTFNEAVNPLTVSTNSINVRANGTTVAGTYTVSGTTVTFTPQTPLPGGATVQVAVSSNAAVSNTLVRDLAGNTGPSTIVSFTTTATLDTTAPTVLGVVPGNGATGIGLDGQVVITFSKSMNPSTIGSAWNNSNISLLVEGSQQQFTVTISADNRTVVLSGLNPAVPTGLPASTVVTVSVPHTVTDLSGNGLAADFASQFTTGPAFDTTHATVVNQRPGNGATGVGINTSPVVLFWNKALNPSTVSGAVHVSQNGEVVAGTVTVADNGQTVEFTASSAWQYSALVQVFVDSTVLDTSGNTVTAYQASFTTVGDPSATAPAVVNYSPAKGATGIPLNALTDVGYSEPLSASTVNMTNVYLQGPAGPVAATVTLDTTGQVIHLNPASPLVALTQYCFNAFNLQGANGLPVAGLNYCFTTGSVAQTTGPTVQMVNPADKLGNVPVNANISVSFSAPIDPLSVNGTTVQVNGGAQTALPASISFSNSNQTIQITPEAPLPTSTVMTLTISGVTDVAGNAVIAQSTQFTTGTSPATATPTVVNVNPPASATGVPINAAISFQASAELDGTTVNSTSFELYDTVLSTPVSGSYSVGADGISAYLVPVAPLAAGRTYASYISYYANISDSAGNQLSKCAYTFTTGSSSSTSAPQVSGVSPSNGLAGVPLNAQILVQFNEPVDSQSLGHVSLAANGSAVGISTSLSNGSQLMSVVPLAGLALNTAYVLTVAGVTDLSGNAMSSAVTLAFTTSSVSDVSQPVTSISPANGATGVLTTAPIQITFSKYMDPLSINGATILIKNGSTQISCIISLNQSATVATLTPSQPLSTNTAYSISVTSAVLDLSGRSVTALQSSFTTGSQ